MLFRKDVLDVCLNVTTTGSTHQSMITDFAIHPLDLKYNPIYIERTDIDIAELVYDEDKKIYDNTRFKSMLHVDHIGESGLMIYKDHDNQIISKIQEYLLELSNSGEYTIRFWVDNPMDWFFFTNLVFPKKRRHIVFPEFVDVIPMSFITAYRMIGQDYSDSIKEVIKSIDDLDGGDTLNKSTSIILARMNRQLLASFKDNFIKI